MASRDHGNCWGVRELAASRTAQSERANVQSSVFCFFFCWICTGSVAYDILTGMVYCYGIPVNQSIHIYLSQWNKKWRAKNEEV